MFPICRTISQLKAHKSGPSAMNQVTTGISMLDETYHLIPIG
jgi:hypothetical protein